ncbi:MAG: hypothetical protein AAGF46_08550 [Pseudomonadota bacterium]
MQDDKHFRWPGEAARADIESEVSESSDVFGHWLSRAPANRRRAAFDPNLYTWKGYRQWKDGVNREWRDRDEAES